METTSAHRRRRLAVAYDPTALSPMQLRDSVGHFCDLVWVVDTTLSHSSPADRLLGRLGTVVDITGLDTEQAAALLATERLDGIIAFSDRRMAVVAAIAAALDLPGLTERCAERVLDKFRQRAAFADAGVDGPRCWRVADGDPAAAAEVISAARLPVVVKPEVGDGSRHVDAAATPERLHELLSTARLAGRDSVVEELIVGDPDFHPELGDYVSVESIVSEGVISHLAVTGRFPVAEPFRETGFFMPALLDEELRSRVLELASASIAALGVDSCCLHTEIKLTPDGPRVIEVNGRPGGGMADLLSLVSDVDLFEVVTRVALGEAVVFEEMVPTSGSAYLLYVQAPRDATRIVGIDGLDEMAQRHGVSMVRVNRPPGSELDWRDGNHGHVFSVLGSTTTAGEVLEASRAAREQVVITCE